MSQISLQEKYVTLPPRSSSRLRLEDGTPPRFTAPTGDAPHDTATVDDALPASAARKGPLAWLRAVGAAIAWTVRAVGVVVGITAAAISVGVLVAVQRILHLG